MDMQEKLEVFKSKNKRCSMDEKKNYYNAWKTSGLSQNKFCQKNHLSLATFSNWVRNIEDKPLSKTSFIPVEVFSEAERDEDIEIQFPNGIKCRIGKIEEVKKISALIKELHHAFIVNSK